MYKPTKTNKRKINKRKIGSPTRPPKAGATGSSPYALRLPPSLTRGGGTATPLSVKDRKRMLRGTPVKVPPRAKPAGPGHMGMGFAGGGKIKTKGYAQGGAMKTKGNAKGGKKFKPPRSKNTGLFG
jgi:hypothetical protein